MQLWRVMNMLLPVPSSQLTRNEYIPIAGGPVQSEIDLRQAVALLSAIGTCSPDPLYAKDLDGRFIYANPALLAAAGKSHVEVIGHTNADFQSNTAEIAAIAAIDQVIVATGRTHISEEAFTAPGRPVQMFRTAKAPLRNDEGAIIGVVGVSSDITQLKATETALRHSEALFRATFEQAAVGIAHIRFDGSILLANDRLCALLGYSYAELRHLTLRDLSHPDDLAASNAAIASLVAGETTTYRIDKRYIRKDGAPVWATLTVSVVRDQHQPPDHCIAVLEDISQRKRAEDFVRASEARLRQLFEGAPLPHYVVDPATTAILDCNAAATTMLGYSRDEFRQMHLADIDVTEEGAHAAPRQLMLAAQPIQFETRHRTRTGDIRDVVVAAVPFEFHGRHLAHGTVIDISDRKRAEAYLKQQTELDSLTSLASRAWFFTALEAALDASTRPPRPRGTLLLVDIDYFKQINDTLGHDAGDALLVEVALRLRQKCRPGDVAARLGGDEFALLIPGLSDERAMASRMTDILSAVGRPVELQGRQVHVSISIGATSFPRDGAGARDLLKNADLALYEAKRSGRARWRFFRAAQAEALDRHVQMADALRDAIEHRRIEVALQPKRLIAGGHAGFEALARWHDGARWVPPGEFVPVAEATGQIGALGRLVMQTALARLKQLRRLRTDPGHVAVNISSADLLDPDFTKHTTALLRRHALHPSDLELEVTETVLLGRTADRVETVLQELRALGISIALDDFGTGFASLSHVTRLSVDRLKIDRTFVSEIGSGGRAGLVARTIIGLARGLGIQSIAEGVETEEQRAFLQSEGCDVIQGYLISRPLLTLDEAAAYLREA